MRKASRILFTISAVLSIVYAVVMIPTSIVFLVLTTPECEQILIDAIKGTTVTVEELRATFLGLGSWFMISGFCAIANAVLCFVARNRRNVVLYVFNIVFGFLSSVVINVVAAIFGLVSINQKD